MARELPQPRGEIHLGELIAALAELPWSDATQARAIAGCLGFGLAAAAANRPDGPTPTIHDRSRPTPLPRREAPAPPSAGYATRPPPPIALPTQVVESRLQPLAALPAADGGAAPAWISAPFQRLDATGGTSPARRALFPDRTARGVFTASLATSHQGGTLDVPALLRVLARGHLPRQLPRLPAMTLNRGCQLLLDFADSMLPWAEDLRQLAAQLAAVLGDERIAVFDFDTSPGTAGQWRAGREQPLPWQPEAGRPVLVATDFGIRGGARSQPAGADWLRFVKACADKDCPLLVLVPWSPTYWPTNLGRHPGLLHWHPSTSAAMVRRQLGRQGPLRR